MSERSSSELGALDCTNFSTLSAAAEKQLLAVGFDYGVSFSPEQVATGEVSYNYGPRRAFGEEMPGISVFYKHGDGSVFHTYSCYARGLDMLNTAYHYLDLVPKGRDEAAGIMSWLRRRDEYGA
jgi:predicted dithiol-disulfide oxidoreductase (DUF899 family)